MSPGKEYFRHHLERVAPRSVIVKTNKKKSKKAGTYHSKFLFFISQSLLQMSQILCYLLKKNKNVTLHVPVLLG